MRGLSLFGPCIPFRVMVKDKRMIILYAIISFDQPLHFIPRFGRFYEDFTLPFTLSLYPFNLSLSLSLSLLSLPPSLYLSFYVSISLLLSLFFLSFSLAYLMDVFVLVFLSRRFYIILLNH